VLKLDSACFQRLKLEHDEPFSKIAYNFKLRRYAEDAFAGLDAAAAAGGSIYVTGARPRSPALSPTRRGGRLYTPEPRPTPREPDMPWWGH